MAFDELSSVNPCRSGLTWSLRFVSGKWHANTLQRCSDLESVLRFVEANWDGEIMIDGQTIAHVAEAEELCDDDEAPPTRRSEEFRIPAPPESQVRLRESEVEV